MNNLVSLWLKAGLLLIFFQVVIGGITRLTESGLSITKWEVVSGTLPPLSDSDWEREYDLYRQTPQYQEINEGLSMADFKFIYFWEYIHRLWARLMGFAFIVPFLYFSIKKKLSSRLKKNLGIVVLLAALAATFGWIMVASGLIERPWVNAYKLSIHLLIAFSVFGYLWWTWLMEFGQPLTVNRFGKNFNKVFLCFGIILFIQLLLGGMMSGMRIAVVYPTWPLQHGTIFPEVLQNTDNWTFENLYNYDMNEFAPAVVHFFHRSTAYLVLILALMMFYIDRKNIAFRWNDSVLLLLVSVLLQVLLGVITVIYSVGEVPVLWGVLHQAGALLLVMSSVNLFFYTKTQEQ